MNTKSGYVYSKDIRRVFVCIQNLGTISTPHLSWHVSEARSGSGTARHRAEGARTTKERNTIISILLPLHACIIGISGLVTITVFYY